MIPLTVSIPPESMRRILADLDATAKGIRKASQRAVNRTMVTGRKNIAKALGQETNLKAASIKEDITITRATGDKTSGLITIAGKLRPLFDFKGVRFGKRGVSVKIFKGKAPTVFRHAFEATVGSGHIGIFQREKRSHGGEKLTSAGFAQRLPIRELMGPSVVGLFENAKDLAQREIDALGPVLEKNLIRELNFVTKYSKADTSAITEGSA